MIFEEYKYLKIDRSPWNIKDPNEPFFNLPKGKYLRKKRDDEFKIREEKREEDKIKRILDKQPPEIEEFLYYFENIDNYIVNVKSVDGPFYSSDDFKIILSDGNKIHLRYSETDGFEDIDFDIKINDGDFIPLTYEQYKIIREKINKFQVDVWGK